LRGRAERMYQFEALEDILATIERLGQRESTLVTVLPRQPGTKESRYMHLLSSGVPEAQVGVGMPAVGPASERAPGEDRVSRLEGGVAELRREIGEMREQLAALRKQFE
jgi:uncharacterized protein YceH (UPF0502 family)